MRLIFTYLTTASLIAGGVVSAASPVVLLKEDFNGSNRRGLAGQLLKNTHISLAKNAGTDGSNAIRVAYVPYTRGSKRVASNYPLSRKVEAATLSFDVCFDRDFDFRKGGKLHGLAPQQPVTGGKPRSAEQWSARLTFKSNGHVATYLYDQNQKAKYGIGEQSRRPVFRKGAWHRIDLQISLNGAGKSDGFVHLFIDGKKVASSKRVNLRGKDSRATLIQNFLFSTFHGGHDPTWSPRGKDGKPTTVHALFDNIIVREGIFVSPKDEQHKRR